MTELEKKYKIANKFLSISDLEEFRDAGLIDELTIRNCQIIQDYVNLRTTNTHLDTIDLLNEKYHISHERISSILYKRNT